MKKNLSAVLLLVLAAVIAVGSVTVLGPCVHADGSEAPCSRARQGVLIAGCVLAVLAVLIFLFRAPAARIILFFLSLCASAAGILLPGAILPLCRMDTMHCRAVMQPAMIILFAAALIVSVVGIIAERSRSRRNRA